MHTLLTIEKEFSGMRLDKLVVLFSHTLFPDSINITRGEIIRLIRSGVVSLDKTIILKPSTKVKEGQTLSFEVLFNKRTQLLPNIDINLPILFESEDFIVLDKLAGIQMHPSAHETFHTVANWYIAHHPLASDVGEDPMRPGIVHRLDKDTTGIVLLAKNQKTFEEMKKLFKNRQVQKTYVALALGTFEDSEGIIQKPIARATNYRRQTIAQKDRYKGTKRTATTLYQVLEQYADFALVEVRPKTGRMHQIRLHLASIGHPVIGDTLYAQKRFRASITTSRQMLHASSIVFELFGKNYHFESSIPPDMKHFLDSQNDTKIKTS